jgi:S-adenosylmethionine:tRNA ribosyltransferase-isomerase
MRRSDFHFELPDELIAQRPAPERGGSRLLHLDRQTGELHDRRFSQLPDLLRPGDLVVFNDTRVIPARLFGHKTGGGRVEILVERITAPRSMLAQVRGAKSLKAGSIITLENGAVLRVEGRSGDFLKLGAEGAADIMSILETAGHVPLPPYIRRTDDAADRERYQTVFARRSGAVAAPTAGLHFTEEMLAELSHRGVDSGFVTLHVGAGTFQPVRADNIDDHRMHREWFEVSAELCAQAQAARMRGGRIVAVGTTAVRCLETAAQDGTPGPAAGETALFIRPGYRFRVVDALLTNFHLPESTLLMLVCAFAGREPVLRAYEHAVRERYRFFSYGDAMLLS